MRLRWSRSGNGRRERWIGMGSPVPASAGVGPLVQRDYWAVFPDCPLRPSELVELASREFPLFAPKDKITFHRTGSDGEPLAVGERLVCAIRHAGRCHVEVVHVDGCSFTLATLPGHPEAGRITFGAYRNGRGDVVFHIRSRARSSTAVRRFGFVIGGEPVQTLTWTDFIDRLAAVVGCGVLGAIEETTRVVSDEPEDRGPPAAPTFLARGD